MRKAAAFMMLALCGWALAQSVTVNAPIGGEQWNATTGHDITWTSSGEARDSINYSVDNGATWLFVDTVPTPLLLYAWTVPNTPSASCLVEVVIVDLGGTVLAADTSPAAFGILPPPAVAVTSPNGAEQWQATTVQSVTWTSAGSIRDSISYSINGGGTWLSEANVAPGGPYSWTVPNTPSANCLVKVSILDAGGTVLDEDSSDAVFEIQTPPPTVLVTLPDGGESWQVGSLHNITWTSTNSTTDSISYSVDNGASWLFVAKQNPPTHTYAWTVPNTPSVICLVKVSAIGSTTVEDQSGAVFAIYSTSIFREDFNGPWTTVSPPAGWRITYTGAPSIAAWHDEPASGGPWFSNGTRYAALYYDFSQPGVHTDSLISPVIDCAIYRAVTLRCSTFFRPDIIQPWTAKLMISGDNGGTWSTLFDYADSVGPGPQTFDISTYADLNSLVRLMWVWQGDLVNLHWWALDNVEVDGIATFAEDISAGPVRRPRKNELPDNPFAPRASFNNVGRSPAIGILVGCELRDHDGILVHSDVQTISLVLGESRVVPFAPPPLGLPADTGYRASFFAITPDDNPLNDTARRKFNVQDQVLFAYDDNVVAGDSHWTSGNAGWGLMVLPDTTPAQILDARFNLHLPNPGTYYYKLRLVDGDGPDNAPGTTLYESGRLVAQEGWNTNTLRDLQLYMWSDTFYLFYLQVDDWPDAAELNHDAARTDSAQYWKYSSGAYRPDSLDADWMIRCSLNLAPIPLTSGVNARTVYVGQPDDELVLRPAGVGFTPKARVENFGGLPIFSLPVLCSIYTRTGTPVYSSQTTVADLNPTEGAEVTFASWVPDFFDSALVVVRTAAGSDVDPNDDVKSKMVYIHQSHYTGFEPLDRYAWIDNDTTGGPHFNWIDTTGAQILIAAAGIDIRVRVPLYPGQFNFFYRDTTFDQFYVCNNGWMALGPDPMTQSYENRPLPDTNAPKPALFPFWDNMYTRGAGSHSKVWYKFVTEGTPHRLVVIWQDMQFYGADTNDLVSFEVILEEGTGFTWFQYKDVEGGLASHSFGRSATVGIQNKDGHRGLQYLYGDTGVAGYYPGNKLTPGRAILYYPLRRDVGVTSIVQPSRSYARPGGLTPQVMVKNYGSFIDPFYVKLRVDSLSNGHAIWRDSVLISSMTIGSETLLVFNTWTAPTGSYTLKCSTAMFSDTTSSNNAKSITLYVQSWLQEKSIPTGYFNKRVRAAAAGFVDPYVYVLKGASTNEVWRYNTQSDTWDSLSSIPVGPRKKKAKDGCAITGGGNYVYAVKGGKTREFYRYDLGSLTWTTMDTVPSAPYGLRNGTAMTWTPGAIYLLVGSNSNNFMKFDLALDTWRYDMPIEGGLMKKVKKGASISSDGGANLYAFKSGNTNEFWQYNVLGQRWITRESVPLGPARKKIKSGSGSGYLGGRIYLTKGGNRNEFWAYDITTRTWKQKSDVPLGPAMKKVKTGATATASNTAFYVLKAGNTTEFWSYGPGFDTLSGFGTRKDPGVQSRSAALPEVFSLRGGPNPFVNAAVIRLAVPMLTRATLKIYDVSGQLVATLLDGMLPAGTRELVWNARDQAQREVANGVYLLKFESSDYKATQKLILQR